MPTAGTESPDTARKPIVNFSRPRQQSRDEDAGDDDESSYGIKSRHNSQPSVKPVKSIQAFHEPNKSNKYTTTSSEPPFPAEPRFSTDSETLSNTSFNARGDAVAAARRGPPTGGLREQRHPGISRVESNNTTTGRQESISTTSSTSRPSTADSLKQLMPIKSILKQTSVEVSSSRASSEGGETVRSHHTVSEDGSTSTVGFEKGGKWSSSDYDTSELSEKEVQKLLKKGKNPALVAEMKAARKGRGIVGVMAGTSYVS